MQEEVDWFSKLELAARERVFTLADFNALSLLSACVEGSGCTIAPQRLLAFYRDLAVRHPTNAQIWIFIARYQSNVLGDDEAAVAALEESLARAPAYPVAYQELLRIRDKNGDVGAVMLAVANILKYDQRRQQLHSVKRMLGLDR